MDEKTKKTQEICAGGEPPRAKGELTFGKLAEQVIRFFSRTFPQHCPFIHCINECHCEEGPSGPDVAIRTPSCEIACPIIA